MRRGKFILIDQSTNGTFIQRGSGEKQFIRRDSTELRGDGVIGLGKEADASAPLAIFFRTEDS